MQMEITQFLLSDPKGTEIWRPQKSVTAATHAAMLDTRNLVLKNRNQNDILTVWESFQEPANTILPTQTLEIGGAMYSQRSENNYSKGRFQLQMKDTGNLRLGTLDSGTECDFYNSRNASDAGNSSNSGIRLSFDESGRIYVLLRNGGETNITSGSGGDYHHRATLHHDGGFRVYNRDKNVDNGSASSNWSIVESIADLICLVESGLGSGICGFNSYCVLDGKGLADFLSPYRCMYQFYIDG